VGVLNQATLFRTRADQIKSSFIAFHKANPVVWKLFCIYTNQLREKGFKNYSARAVIHRVRWHVNIETRSEDGLKINDHYSPYYARMYMATYPEAKGFFRNRKRTSENRCSYGENVQYFHSGDPEDETDLLEELRKLAQNTEDVNIPLTTK
jgi:hypothetical protein